MSSVLKLKNEARRFEQQEDWDGAIQLYLRVLRTAEETGSDVELPLYNRVGDLYLKLGRAPDAVTYYERAADRYAEAGFYSNALALCNKALRHAPHQLELMRKLGRFSALQGFVTDARRWFLTYAERMFSQGSTDDALGALEDFANLSDDPEIRELLAGHLHAHGRREQALTEFRRALGMRLAVGARTDALRAEVLRLYPHEADLQPAPLARSRGHDDRDDAAMTGRLPGFEATTLPGFDADALPGLDAGALPGFEPDPPIDLDTLDVERTTAAWFDATVSPIEDLPPLPPLDAPSPAGEAVTRESLNGSAPDVTVRSRPDETPNGSGVDGYIDLHSFLEQGTNGSADMRFQVEEAEPTGDEDRDFAGLLVQFRAKLREAVDPDDADSHYDLGLAFKEMGLVDEAIGEFQSVMRAGGQDRLRILEELGHCFLLKGESGVAAKILETAVTMRGVGELELLGVFYYLGLAYEALGRATEARDAYERVLGLDIDFKDVSDRIVRL